MTRLRDERGGIIVLAAVVIPVFLLFGALVVDAGNWFTHKRQLQNRADAAAFAAGTAYADNWPACVQDDDLASKTQAAQRIANAARQYAADPEAADYNKPPTLPVPGVPPTSLYNANITKQSSIDVVVNSTSHDNNTDYSDDGDPCFDHAGDAISPVGGQWTDVKVKENKVGGLWRNFLPTIPAAARVEVHPAISAQGMLPLAIPDNVVTKVQVRYFDGCNPSAPPILVQDLAQLPDGDYNAYQSSGGGTLWAIPIPSSDPPVGDKNRRVDLPMPAYDPVDCGRLGLPYRPITEQVRIASSDNVNIDDPTCAQLKDTSFADCFERLSQIRSWDDGDPSADEPLLKDVNIIGGCGAPGDGYFGTLPLGETDCTIGVTAQVDWGTRDDGAKGDPASEANFIVSANGTPLAQISNVGGTRTYSSNNVDAALPGATDVTITLKWEDTNPAHNWNGTCTTGTGNPCKYGPAPQLAHRTFVGENSPCTKTSGPCADPNATGAVESVHTSLSPIDGTGALGGSFDNWAPGALGCTPTPPYSCPIFPTVGIRSALTAGTLTALRVGQSQGNNLLDCTPGITAPLENFQNGCQPWYWKNTFTDPNWWISATQACPESTLWWKPPGSQVAPYVNSSINPWLCVLQYGGVKTGQAGDWMAVATDNCLQVNNSLVQCQQFKSKTTTPPANCGNYDGTPGDPNGWLQQGGSSDDPRVVMLFIVPYQALKNAGGGGLNDEIPILKLASFYVMNWWGKDGGGDASSDPCPDPDFGTTDVEPPGKATIIGVFKSTVDFRPGPVDLTAKCVEEDPTPCKAVLVR